MMNTDSMESMPTFFSDVRVFKQHSGVKRNIIASITPFLIHGLFWYPIKSMNGVVKSRKMMPYPIQVMKQSENTMI